MYEELGSVPDTVRENKKKKTMLNTKNVITPSEKL